MIYCPLPIPILKIPKNFEFQVRFHERQGCAGDRLHLSGSPDAK